MANTDKQLAELLAEEKKLLEQAEGRSRMRSSKNSVPSRNSSGRKSAN